MEHKFDWLEKVRMISTKETLAFDIADYDWFKKQGLAVYYFSQINSMPNHQRLSIESAIYMEGQLMGAIEVFDMFNKNEINYVLLKGYGLAFTYDAYYQRPFGDLDILVDDHDLDDAIKLIISLGYTENIAYASEKHIGFEKKGSLPIELHNKALNLEYEESALDAWLLTSPICIMYKSSKIRVPLPEPHYYFIVLHMIHHFYSGGCGVRHLLDIKYFIEKYTIEPRDYLERFEAHGLGKLYRVIISLCVYYLDLKNMKCDWLIDIQDPILYEVFCYMSDNGFLGKGNDANRVRNLRVEFLNPWKKGQFIHAIKRTFFPTGYKLPFQCRYALDKPYLLPIAWLHRIISHVFSRKKSVSEKFFFLNDPKEMTNKRNQLMKALEIDK